MTLQGSQTSGRRCRLSSEHLAWTPLLSYLYRTVLHSKHPIAIEYAEKSEEEEHDDDDEEALAARLACVSAGEDAPAKGALGDSSCNNLLL